MASTEIAGYGSKGKVIHALVCYDGINYRQLCDKRSENVPVFKGKTILDVSCKKCMEYSAAKELWNKTPTPGAPVTKDVGVTTEKPKSKTAMPDIKAEAAKHAEKEKPKLDVNAPHWKATLKGEDASIYHVPTGQVFFEVPKEMADAILDGLNNLKEKWSSKNDPLPSKDWITTLRLIVKKSYQKMGKEIPNYLADVKEKEGKKKRKDPERVAEEVASKADPSSEAAKAKSKRKIKRRDKSKVKKEKKAKGESKRKLKRRKEKPRKEKPRKEKPVVNELGQMAGKPPFTVTQQTLQGISHKHLVDMLMEQYGLTETRANAKIRGINRKNTRNHGCTLVTTAGSDPRNDYYELKLPKS